MNHGKFKAYQHGKTSGGLGKALNKAAAKLNPKSKPPKKKKVQPVPENQQSLFPPLGIYRGTFPIEI